MIEDAKSEASTLINQAGTRGDQIVEEAKTQASEEQQKIKTAAEADIEQNVSKAKENLKQEVSALVIAGAAKILEKEVDEKSNKEIIDELIKRALMAEYLTQSRPYAEAIFEIAEQDNSVDSWIKDLALISTSFQDNLIQALIDTPDISQREKAEKFVSIFEGEVSQKQ